MHLFFVSYFSTRIGFPLTLEQILPQPLPALRRISSRSGRQPMT